MQRDGVLVYKYTMKIFKSNVIGAVTSVEISEQIPKNAEFQKVVITLPANAPSIVTLRETMQYAEQYVKDQLRGKKLVGITNVIPTTSTTVTMDLCLVSAVPEIEI